MKRNITVNDIIVKNNMVDISFFTSENLKRYFNNDHLFYQYNYDVSNVPNSILIIPFIANVIPLVWITNSKISIDEIDKSFFYCLEKVKEAFIKMYPNLQFNGDISFNKLVENTYEYEQESAQLFSGGLDALTTYIRIRNSNPLLITEYGWHNDQVEESEVWSADFSHASNFARSNNLENILIHSNYGTLFNAKEINREYQSNLGDTWWHGLHHGLAIISAAIPITFLLKVKNIYIASSNTALYPVTCASDPSIDNEIKFASGGVIHDGYELSRQDKIGVLINYSKVEKRNDLKLRVCFLQEENCCKCEKCLRTIFGILAEGSDPTKFGFEVSNLMINLKSFLDSEVKFFTKSFIEMYWLVIQKRMDDNREQIKNKEILEWFLHYDFVSERKKSLLRYRIYNFFPIVNRKLRIAVSEHLKKKRIEI